MSHKIKVGIFFGGSSREREVSFAGGRTVYDNLNKSIFEPIPIFVDSFQNLVILNWEFIYKGSIRDFYPPVNFLPNLPNAYQIYAESINPDRETQLKMLESLGECISLEELPTKIDFAFLALHGSKGEDGSIQGALEWLNIPYSGSHILASALGMNKRIQKVLQQGANLYNNSFESIDRSWFALSNDKKLALYHHYNTKFNNEYVIKAANQGSSLGVSVLRNSDFDAFVQAMNLAFFTIDLNKLEWEQKNEEEKISWIKHITDLRSGLGLPLICNQKLVFSPHELEQFLNQYFETNVLAVLEAIHSETEAVIEQYIDGREFSCIVLNNTDGSAFALPPTEIVKSTEMYDYRSKYLPGLSRKITPMQVSAAQLQQIRSACVELYHFFGFNVYARIDGFVDNNGQIFLNDPNTTSGMMPSSFFFHQAAEIGLDPNSFITYIIRISLQENINHGISAAKSNELLGQLKAYIDAENHSTNIKTKIAVIMGGYSFERHISMESGRNIYEKLKSSEKYLPIPIFLLKQNEQLKLYEMPISYMLKDNADDIAQKILENKPNAILTQIKNDALNILSNCGVEKALYEPKEISFPELPQICEGVFIALHGRPGEDGTLQHELQKLGLYFNGSIPQSAAITIDKFETNTLLRKARFLVAENELVQKLDWEKNPNEYAQKLIAQFGIPFICKPHDDGCSAAVRKIKDKEELLAFAKTIFRNELKISNELAAELNISPNDEFPIKTCFLAEKFIDRAGAARFLEVTGGMLTSLDTNGNLQYEIFEPSESLAESEILSLEEKFLAGQGQNITPSRFSSDIKEQQIISQSVRATLLEVAKTLNVTGYCRIDAFVRIFSDNRVETVIIEVNSLPGMTPATCIYHQAAINGYKPLDFIDKILMFGKSTQKFHA